jgi:hypothetical protein
MYVVHRFTTITCLKTFKLCWRQVHPCAATSRVLFELPLSSWLPIIDRDISSP